MRERNQVLSRRAAENYRLGVHGVAGFTSSNLTTCTMFGIRSLFAREDNIMHLYIYISLKHITFLLLRHLFIRF